MVRNLVMLPFNKTVETLKKSCCSCPPTILAPLDVEAATKYGPCSGRSGVLQQCNDVISNMEDDRKCSQNVVCILLVILIVYNLSD